jgi:hypothetical protein
MVWDARPAVKAAYDKTAKFRAIPALSRWLLVGRLKAG